MKLWSQHLPFVFIGLAFVASFSGARDAKGANIFAPLFQKKAEHGDLMVTTLLRDRPQLRLIIWPGNPLWVWLRNAFDAPNNGSAIFWDRTPTRDDNLFGGETDFSQHPNVCLIRIDRYYKQGAHVGDERLPEELLQNLAFELDNASNWPQAHKLWPMAEHGTISKTDFILTVARAEFSSELALRKFYTQVWLPFCKAHHLRSDAHLWHMSVPDTFEAWIRHYPPGSTYPWRTYGDQYDAIVAGRVGTAATP